MALKLFRSTGYSSILAPGETRVGTHPGWVVLALSLWIGFACNVDLWRALRGLDSAGGMNRALLTSVFIAGLVAALLSLLGWRRIFKKAATLMLLLAALGASAIWIQGLPVDANLLDRGLRSLVIPQWPTLLRWQMPAILVVLGLLPMLWLWQLQMRRLPGPEQLVANGIGMMLGIAAMAASVYWLR